jgi:hypothetical protein
MKYTVYDSAGLRIVLVLDGYYVDTGGEFTVTSRTYRVTLRSGGREFTSEVPV